MTFLKRFDVLRIFGKVKCPHCSEQLQIFDATLNDLDDDFREFTTTNTSADIKCIKFNNLLNEKLRALSENKISEKEVIDWTSTLR